MSDGDVTDASSRVPIARSMWETVDVSCLVWQ
jgi:hypothetical protein